MLISGTPEQVASCKHSWTGKYLAPILAASPHSDFELPEEEEWSEEEAASEEWREEWAEDWDEDEIEAVER